MASAPAGWSTGTSPTSNAGSLRVNGDRPLVLSVGVTAGQLDASRRGVLPIPQAGVRAHAPVLQKVRSPRDVRVVAHGFRPGGLVDRYFHHVECLLFEALLTHVLQMDSLGKPIPWQGQPVYVRAVCAVGAFQSRRGSRTFQLLSTHVRRTVLVASVEQHHGELLICRFVFQAITAGL